jgi:hypothetical protein
MSTTYTVMEIRTPWLTLGLLGHRSRMLLLPLPLLAQRLAQRIPLRLCLQRQRLTDLWRTIDHQSLHENLLGEHSEWTTGTQR